MLMPRYVAGLAGVALMVMNMGLVSGQDYPNKPIRIITGPIGGGGDFQTRTIGQAISGPLGQSIVVDNRPNNLIGEVGAKAAPDGYTLVLTGASLWNLPLLQNVNYDPQKDFAPIALIERSPNILVIHPALPVKSVKELIALAKARPGELNSASASADTRIAAELFKALAGVKIVNIAYSSGAVEFADLIGGQVQMAFGGTASVTPHMKSGRLRALAVTTPQPSALYPDLPTMASTVPGYEAAAKAAMFAPVGTPPAILNRINQEVVRFLRTPAAKEKFASTGSEVVTSTPEELAATIKADMARSGKVIKDAGLRTN